MKLRFEENSFKEYAGKNQIIGQRFHWVKNETREKLSRIYIDLWRKK